MEENAVLLAVKNLEKRYKSFALTDINFTLQKGYILGYVGANGSGKSTTLNLIAGVLKPTAGEVRIDGLSHAENPAAYKERIGYVGDESFFSDHFTPRHIRGILKNFYQSFDPEKFDTFLKKWNLPEKKPVKQFSRGMKAMLMFAAALSRETKILVLDEATNGLDPVMRVEIIRLLQEYVMDGEHSVIFSTHILSDLEQIADYIYFIYKGRTLLSDEKEEIAESFLLVRGDKAALTEETRRGLIGLEENAYSFTALMESEKAQFLGKDFQCEKPTIDQIVVHFIQNEKGDACEKSH